MNDEKTREEILDELPEMEKLLMEILEEQKNNNA